MLVAVLEVSDEAGDVFVALAKRCHTRVNWSVTAANRTRRLGLNDAVSQKLQPQRPPLIDVRTGKKTGINANFLDASPNVRASGFQKRGNVEPLTRMRFVEGKCSVMLFF